MFALHQALCWGHSTCCCSGRPPIPHLQTEKLCGSCELDHHTIAESRWIDTQEGKDCSGMNVDNLQSLRQQEGFPKT